ncbi:MAG: hypothetical protein ACLSH5_06565 [Christensenellales bacterium]
MKKLVALVMTALCLLAVGCSKQEDDQIIDVVVPSTPEAVVTPVPTPETPAETPAPAYTSPIPSRSQPRRPRTTRPWAG